MTQAKTKPVTVTTISGLAKTPTPQNLSENPRTKNGMDLHGDSEDQGFQPQPLRLS